MNRKPRNLTPHLRAEYARQFPHRPPKEEFDDQILVLGVVLMRQIDPTGKLPVIEPPAYPEGYEPQPDVKASVKRGRATE